MVRKITITIYAMAALLVSVEAKAQCGDSIDLGTWVKEGQPANGDWQVTNGGNNVRQYINGNPTFYVSPDSFINVIITGKIRVDHPSMYNNNFVDDDWVGFVFGHNGPTSATANNFYDTYLFDWKRAQQNFGGYTGPQGMALSRVQGTVTNLDQAFAGHTGPTTLIASNWGGGTGWNYNQSYSFALTYTNTRVVIAIDGDTIFNITGCFAPGRFGFYNYSQQYVNYFDFSYKVAAAFQVLTPDVCIGDTAKMVAVSESCATGSSFDNTIVSWLWDFGDGQTSNDTNPLHLYDSVGIYTVALEVTDYLGCKDTAYSTIHITDTVLVLDLDTTICQESTVAFTAPAGYASYTWSTGATNQTANINAAGQHFLTVTSSYGCPGVDTLTITHHTPPTVDLGPDTSICNTDTIALHAVGAGLVSYLWFDNTTFDSVLVDDPGTFYVEVTDTNTCIGRDTVEVTQFAQPTITPPNPTYCFGDSVTVTASGAATYTWSPNFALSATTGAVVQIFSPVDTTYKVVGVDTNGCMDSVNFFVEVHDLPTASMTGGDTICDGETIPLTITLTGQGPWDFVYELGGSTFSMNGLTLNTNIITVSDSGLYQPVSIQDANCLANGGDSTLVVVHQLPAINLGPDTTVCNHDTVIFHAYNPSVVSYLWQDNSTLDSFLVVNSPGLYYCLITDSNGCQNSDTVDISNYAEPNVTPPNPMFCAGDTITMTASGANTYQWYPNYFISALTGTMVDIYSMQDTTYFVVGTDTNGCIDTASFFADVIPLPTATITGGDSICAGDNITLNIAFTGTTPWNLVYANITAQDTFTLNGQAVASFNFVTSDSGVYQPINISDATCDNTGGGSTTVVLNPLPVVVLTTASDTICEADSVAINASGAASYVWSPATGLNSTTLDSVLASPPATITYTVTGTSIHGCVNDSTIEIEVLPLPVITIDALNDTVCMAQDTAYIAATGGATYLWVSQPGGQLFTTSIIAVSPAVPTIYEVFVTAANGCLDSLEAPVEIDTLPIVYAFPEDTAYCIFDTAQLSAFGANTYAWTPSFSLSAATGNTVQAYPTDTTVYYVTGTDLNGCWGTDSAVVNIWPLPLVVASSNDPEVCFGLYDTLTASGALTYAWSPNYNINTTTGNTVIVYSQLDTTYIVTGTDNHGCTNTDTVNLTSLPLPSVVMVADTDSVCKLITTQLTASGAVTYKWANTPGLSAYNQAIVTAQPLVTSTYEVYGMDNKGCVDSVETTITVLPLPVIPITPTQNNAGICVGDSRQLTIANGYTYQWSPTTYLLLDGNNNDTVIATPPDTTLYTITATDHFECVSDTIFRLNVTPLPVITVSKDDPIICSNGSTHLHATGGLSYVWGPVVNMTGALSANPLVTPDVTQKYYVTATGPANCQSVDSIVVNVYPIPNFSAGDDEEVCENDTIKLKAKGGVSYYWQPFVDISDPNIQDPLCFPQISRSYNVTITDANGCTYTDGMFVKVHDLPVVDAGQNHVICKGETATLGGNPTGPAGSAYKWSPTTALNSSIVSGPDATPTDTTLYSVTVTDVHGCKGEDKVWVYVKPLPVMKLLKKPSYICYGDSGIASVTEGLVSYNWKPAGAALNPNQSSTLIFPRISSNISVIGEGANGCFTTVAFDLEVKPLPTVSAGGDQQLCEGDTLSVYGTVGATVVEHFWSPDTLVANKDSLITVAFPTERTWFLLTATDNFGCVNYDSAYVHVYPYPRADAGEDITNCNIETVYLGTDYTTDPENKILWWPADYLSDPYSPNPYVTVPENVMYYLKVTTPEGCVNTDSIYVEGDCYAKVYIPSAFSPDGDGINELFLISAHRITDPYIVIRDKWGHIVFETYDVEVGWDGTVKGLPAKSDVYYIEVSYHTEEGRLQGERSTLTLLR